MMDLDVVTKTGDCPHIVKCYGYFITQVRLFVLLFMKITYPEGMIIRITCFTQKEEEINVKKRKEFEIT